VKKRFLNCNIYSTACEKTDELGWFLWIYSQNFRGLTTSKLQKASGNRICTCVMVSKTKTLLTTGSKPLFAWIPTSQLETDAMSRHLTPPGNRSTRNAWGLAADLMGSEIRLSFSGTRDLTEVWSTSHFHKEIVIRAGKRYFTQISHTVPYLTQNRCKCCFCRKRYARFQSTFVFRSIQDSGIHSIPMWYPQKNST